MSKVIHRIFADCEADKCSAAKFEVDKCRAEKVEVVDDSVRMPKLKQTPRKRTEAFPCHVCQEVFSQYYNRKRHLAKHGINEKGEKLTQDEQDRLLGYNRHKKKPAKSEAKKGTSTTVEDASTSKKQTKFKSVEFVSSSDSSSSSDQDSSSSDSESDTSTSPVAAAVVPASTAPRTLTASDIASAAEAAKLAVE